MLCLISPPLSFRVAKATGCRPLPKYCSKMAPTAASLASVVTKNCRSKSGSFRDRGCSPCQLQPVERLVLRRGQIPLNSNSRQLRQRTHHLTESPHEPPVIRGQSKKSAHVMDTLRFGPLNNCPNLLWRGLNSSRADFKTKVINLVFQKFAFAKSRVQLALPELFQCPPKMFPMLIHVLTEHQDIVQINCNEFYNTICEDLVHQQLKTGGCMHNPNGMTRNSKCPRVVQKAVF